MCLILRCVLVSSEPYCTLSISAARTAKGVSTPSNLAPATKTSAVSDMQTMRHPRAGRCVDALRFAIPDIDAAIADRREALALDLDIDGAGRWHDAGLITRHPIFECLAALQLDDVEIVERHARIVHIDDGLVGVVEWRNVHVLPFRCETLCGAMKLASSSGEGMAGAQPTRVTTMAAAADPRKTQSFDVEAGGKPGDEARP